MVKCKEPKPILVVDSEGKPLTADDPHRKSGLRKPVNNWELYTALLLTGEKAGAKRIRQRRQQMTRRHLPIEKNR